MGLLVARSRQAANTPITGDAAANAVNAGQLLLLRRSLRVGVDMIMSPALAHW
jgi:hypothetical protein